MAIEKPNIIITAPAFNMAPRIPTGPSTDTLPEVIGKLPKTFDTKKLYRVQMTKVEALPGFPDHLLRPMDDVILGGDVAEQLRGSISAAAEIVEPGA